VLQRPRAHLALLAALRGVQQGLEGGKAAVGRAGHGAQKRPIKQALSQGKRRKQMTPDEQLGVMLAEAAAADAAQEGFLQEQQAVKPDDAERPRRQQPGRKRGACSGFPAVLTCCACRDQCPAAAMVPCAFATKSIAYVKRAMRTWARASASTRRGRKSTTPSTQAYVANKLREVAKDVEPHVFCASCLRTYLMGTTVHGGDLRKMFCPGCTKLLRDSAEVSNGGWYWCHDCGEFHYSGDSSDMTGLGLDGIREETGLQGVQPLSPELLTKVLGPLDLLRLRSVAAANVESPKVAHGVLRALRKQGARRCSFCGQAHVVDGGCNAVLCESCGLVFDWAAAKPV